METDDAGAKIRAVFNPEVCSRKIFDLRRFGDEGFAQFSSGYGEIRQMSRYVSEYIY